MKQYMRILTIQDISCVGQCSMTVALPILSACGIETCILPTAVLSTHTGGFKGFTVHDLVDEIPKITEHWKKEGIFFDAVYTGYLGSEKHISMVMRIADDLLKDGGKLIVDPAMADNGKLYPAFNMEYVDAMKELCRKADIILPNLTEACLLAESSIPQSYDEDIIKEIYEKLEIKADVVMTGIGFTPSETGVAMFTKDGFSHYAHRKIERSFHGTGDVFASAFVGAYLQSGEILHAVKQAADYTLSCIENTVDDPSHWYGVKFEPQLRELMSIFK